MTRLKPYSVYKGSGIKWLGDIPKDWTLVPLKYLALLNPRKSGFVGDTDQVCSFIPMEKLRTGSILLDEERAIAEVIIGYTYFVEGDVLQAKVTPCFENKNIAIAKGLTNGIGFGSSEINVFRPYTNVRAEYLYYRIQEDCYMGLCTSSMIGAGGLRRVPTDVINNFTIAAPNIFEQIQIARFLDYETVRIDALIKEQQRLIELLKEKRQAEIYYSVTKGLQPTVPMKDSGVEWLGELPAHWVCTKLGRLAFMQEGPGLRNWQFTDHGTRVICVTNITENGINFDKFEKFISEKEYFSLYRHFTVRSGDLLLSSSGNSWGKVAEYTGVEPVILNTSTIRLNELAPLRLTREFLRWFLESKTCREQLDVAMTGACQPNFGPTHLNDVIAACPPIHEQIAISSYLDIKVSEFRGLIRVALEMVDTLKERRSALISAAVTGKIDVRDWQPPISAKLQELEKEAM